MTAQIAEHANAIADLKSQLSKVVLSQHGRPPEWISSILDRNQRRWQRKKPSC